MKTKYVIISPVRDEEKHVEKTIKSVVAQTIKPLEWIIVDDGSNDNTSMIIKHYLPEHLWIKLITKKDHAYRYWGGGVVEAFYYGFQNINSSDYEFITKLDGDIELPPEYFETLFNRFKENPNLGIGGGQCYLLKNNNLIIEKRPLFHVPGPIKTYRKKCFIEIGGLVPHLGWDLIDLAKAQMLGWETRGFRNLKVVHLRPTSSECGILKGKMREGKAVYYAGTHPIFIIARAFYRIFDRPFFIGSLMLLCGYFLCLIKRERRYHDVKLIKFLQKQQLHRLVRLKTREY
jgi:glycosyltransferase involved in cell wall biosynthesis